MEYRSLYTHTPNTKRECDFFFSSRRRHTRYWRDWSSDVCSSDLEQPGAQARVELVVPRRVERVRHVEPSAVERELDHLRPAVQLAAGVALLAEEPAEPELARQLDRKSVV